MASSFVCLASLFLMVLRNSWFSRASPVSKIDDLEVCDTQVCQESARFLLDAMDTNINPCDDFYRYACGGWIQKHPMPEGRTRYSVTDHLNDNVYSIVAESLRNATNENHPKAIIDAAILFQGCIDEGARERHGLNPLRNILNSIGGWPMINPRWNNTDYKWYKQVATIRRTLGIRAIISVDMEETESLTYGIELQQPAFGIQSEHLENQTSERSQEIIESYRNFIISTGKLLNPDMDEISLGNDADEIIQFESDLAAEPEPLPKEETKKTWYTELMDFLERVITRNRSPPLRSTEHTISDVQRITQNEYFQWTDFLNEVLQDLPQVTDKTKILSVSMSYLKHAVELVENTDPRIVANYIGWILLLNIGHHSTKDFRDNTSRFLKAIDYETLNLEKMCVRETAHVLNFAVGRLYIDKYIGEEEMLEVEQLAEDIRSTFEVNFNHNDWMDPPTTQKALEKLRHMVPLIGYPNWIKIDSELNDYYRSVNDVRQDEYFESYVRAKAAVEWIKLRKLNQKIHRTTDWTPYMDLTEVDAMYNSQLNTMYFPVAIFNSPIYKHGRPPALNYAGFGSFIAHEITHGFDSDGHHYDKDGKHVDWWSAETRRMFEEKVECLREQYSKIVEPMTNTSLSVGNTLPDDISDNGAVRNSFMAYKIQVLQAEENEVTKRNLRLPGLSATPEQLYFLGLASQDCTPHTKRTMKLTIENDSHSPSQYRVNMPLRNSRAFANAFSCPLGSPMNPEQKCQLW